jgi:signal transduction histidine kinase/CheY-like chemotaxis protein
MSPVSAPVTIDPSPQQPSPSLPTAVATTAGLYALGGGAVSLLGWALDIPRLMDWEGSGITMKPNAAICAMVAGVALGLAAQARAGDRVIRALGAFVALIGGLTLFEHLSGLNLGIDTLLFDEARGAAATAAPGRMGPPASTVFTLLGTALFLLTGGHRERRWVAVIGLVTLGVSALSVVGYLYGASQLYQVPRLTGIAFQTATILVALSGGLVAAVPEHGLVAALRRDDASGVILRRLLPTVVLIALVLGWLRLEGEAAGLYDTPFGAAARTLIEIILLVGVLWWTANGINRMARTAGDAERARRTSEASERMRRKELDELMRAAPAAIWVAHDTQCLQITGNPAAAAMMRLPSQENLSKTGPVPQLTRHAHVYRNGELLTPGELPMQMAARTGRPVPYQELEFRFPDGSSKWAYGNAVPLLDALGQVRGAVATFVDITELKNVQELLRETDRRKDEFLATLAHELRNPLAPLRNGLEIMRIASRDAAVFAHTQQMMERQLAHLIRLVDDLLDVSRIRRGLFELRRGRVALAPILADALEASRPLIDAAGHQVVVNQPSEPLFVDGDATRLAQVFANLLNNAAQYTDRGGRIELSVERQGVEGVVSVRDNGVGIDAARVDSLFDMFTQGDRRLERAHGGLGVGLTLVKQLVEMHGGRVRASSDGPGRGSAFVVRLPLILHRAVDDAPHPRVAIRPPAPRRVLVVDDNRDSAASLAELLTLAGNPTEVAYDGVEAIVTAERFQPDVMLLDIGMPRMNGYDTCRAIRAKDWGKDIVIVALTGWGQEEDRQKSRDAGFDDHLVKPVSYDDLIGLLQTRRNENVSARA